MIAVDSLAFLPLLTTSEAKIVYVLKSWEIYVRQIHEYRPFYVKVASEWVRFVGCWIRHRDLSPKFDHVTIGKEALAPIVLSIAISCCTKESTAAGSIGMRRATDSSSPSASDPSPRSLSSTTA